MRKRPLTGLAILLGREGSGWSGISDMLKRSGRRVYRTGDAKVVVAFYNLMAIGWIVAALFPSPAQGFCIGAAVFFSIWAAWSWQYGVRVTSRGVTVATIVLAKRVPWSEIERFELVPISNIRSEFAVVKRGARRMVVSSALSTPAKPPEKVARYRREIQAVVDELNQLMAERATSPNPEASTTTHQ